MKWIDIKQSHTDLEQSVLVAAKEGNYWPEIHGEKDERAVLFYVGHFYNEHECFKTLKPKIEFYVDCGCSGPEFDKANLEVLFWMPLPKLPEEE